MSDKKKMKRQTMKIVLAVMALCFALNTATAAQNAAARTQETETKKTAAAAARTQEPAAKAAGTGAKTGVNTPGTVVDAATASDTTAAVGDTTVNELLDEAALELSDTAAIDQMAEGGAYTQLKTKFVDGGAGFMSLVALVLILGLACCIERIVYLSMSEIDAKKFMQELEQKLKTDGVESAKELCRNTRGPVASICFQGLLRIKDTAESIERSVASYASVQVGNMEKGCSWITLFIAMAPSLGFLGTVIGMVLSFENIEIASDISPTIVASGMKVALITTIFGIITALILQLFYNYILSKIDHLTAQMEESAITLMDIITEEKSNGKA